MPDRLTNADLPTPPPIYGTSLVDRMNLALHVRRYFKIAVRRWWALAICTFAGVGYNGYKAYTSPDIFQASSVIEVAPRVLVSGGSMKPVVSEETISFYQRQAALLEGSTIRSNVDQRVEALRPFGASTIVSRRAVRPPGDSAFTLIVQGRELQVTRICATNWANEFIRLKENEREENLGKSETSLKQSLATQEKLLERAKAALDSFRLTNKIDTIQGTRESAERRLSELLRQQLEIRTRRELIENKSVEAYILDPIAAPNARSTAPRRENSENSAPSAADPSDFAPTARYANLRIAVKNAEAQRELFATTLKPAHPVLVQLDRDLDKLKRELTDFLSIREQERLALIEDFRKQELAYQPLIEDARREIARLTDIDGAYKRLNETVDDHKKIRDQINSDLMQFQLALDNEDQFGIRERLQSSDVPILPNRPKMVLMGLAVGLLSGIALIYFLHRLDDRLELAADIETALDQPVLGQIPLVDLRASKREHLLITQNDQADFFAESIRGIRSAVMFGAKQSGKQVLLVTSAVPGDGKTTFTVNFAATLALAGNRVLLVDSDLRRGIAHGFFGFDRPSGLSEVLAGQLHWSDVARDTPIKGLQIITSGRLPANPGELLISPVTHELIQETRELFDYVVFDCPPLTAIDDTFSLVGFADGILFVVRAGQTSMRFAKNALAALEHRDACVLGIVLNGITADNPYYYYHSYYHAYYHKAKSTAQEPGAVTVPARKMALPKAKLVSIEVEAKARAGQKTTPETIAAEEQSKTEMFRKRRAARRDTAESDTSFNAAEPSATALPPQESTSRPDKA